MFEVSHEHDGYHVVNNCGFARFDAILMPLWTRSPVFDTEHEAIEWLDAHIDELY